MDDKDKEQLKEDCKNAEAMRQESIKSADSMLRFLSAGGLTLSLTIYDKLYNYRVSYLLIATWIFYFLALLSTLISFYTAQKAFDEQILCNRARLDDRQYDPKCFVKYNTWTINLNYLSLSMFFLGSITFLIFSSINLLYKDNTMINKQLQNGLTCNTFSKQNISSSDKMLLEGLTPSTESSQISKGLTPSTTSTNNTSGTNTSNTSNTSQSSKK